MITGVVTVDLQAIIRLTIHGPTGQQIDIDAMIDSGFNGRLTLAPTLIAQLGLTWQQRGGALLADGSAGIFDIYEGVVIWDGQPRHVAVHEADATPLVGMGLLEDYELSFPTAEAGGFPVHPARRAPSSKARLARA